MDTEQLSPRMQAWVKRERKERQRQEREAARQQAEMERQLKLAFQPVLEWLSENSEQPETAI